MSEMIDAAVKALSAKLTGGFDGVAKFVIPGEGAIMLDPAGIRAGDEPADVTLTAGQTLCLRIGAPGRSTSGSDPTSYTSQSLIRNVRYLAEQRSLIGI